MTDTQDTYADHILQLMLQDTYARNILRGVKRPKSASCAVDATDQNKTRVPICAHHGKRLEKMYQIKFKLTGFLVHG